MSEIVFLAHRVPYPPNRGDKIRSWNVLKALAKIAPVHVVALCDDEADLAHRDVIDSVAASVQLVPVKTSRIEAMAKSLLTGGSASVAACASNQCHAALEQIRRTHPVSAIYAYSGQMAQFVPSEPDARFVMDFVDMDSAKFEAWGAERGGLSGFANRQEAKRLFAFERDTAERADVSLFVSDAEARLFQDRSGLDAKRVQTLENGIDLEAFAPDHLGRASNPGSGPLAVFTGQMDYAPNVEAVEWFARRVLPLAPELHFVIVGRAPTATVTALGALPNVTVTGAVDDTRDWIAAADIVVAPLQLARGVQNKVLEAMAMGKAVVASPAAAEGIDALAGRDLIVAETPEAQAAAINALLADSVRKAEIGRAARAQMEAHYSWDSTLARLPELMGFAA